MAKIVTLGEIMLRLSTPDSVRLAQTETFTSHYGGGEANVAISLANYGHEVYFASKVPNNALGEGVKKHLQRYGVQTKFLSMGGPRLGTYYVESGIGERAATVLYDRANSSFAALNKCEWPLEELFQDAQVFHLSGITPALSADWLDFTLELMKTARTAGCLVSFDINYRSKLWSQKAASDALNKLLPLVDYCSAGELDARYLLAIPEKSLEDPLLKMDYFYSAVQEKFPNIQVFYATNRQVYSASAHDLTGMIWAEGQIVSSKTHHIEPIVDRVGGGDAFSGAILHGLLAGWEFQKIINFATTAAAMKHTIAGDCNQFSEAEIYQVMERTAGQIVR